MTVAPPPGPGDPPPGPGGGEPGSDYETVPLIANGGFEDLGEPTGCFEPFSQSDGAVANTATAPLDGEYSLHATVSPFGRVSCAHEYGEGQGPLARRVTVTGTVRIDSPAAGGEPLLVCVVLYYSGSQQDHKSCQPVSAGRGPTTARVEIDPGSERLRLAIFQLEAGGTPIEATLDDAQLTVERLRGSEGTHGGGGGGGGGGGASRACEEAIANGQEPAPSGPPDPASPCDLNLTPAATPAYTPAPLTLPAARPFISLSGYLQAPTSSPIFEAFKTWVNRNVFEGFDGYLYSSSDAVIMYARTGNTAYIDDAIARLDAEVSAAEAKIAAGEPPAVADDRYLDAGSLVEELALTYDYGLSSGRLSAARQQRWKAYGDQVVANIWNPATATWGTRPAGTFAWSGWAINDPGDNYHFSFLKATELWALATQNHAWFDFLQTYKFPALAAYYAQLPGGGSREGTGYGAAQRDLWEDARIWRESTGEDLAAVRSQARESIDYWIHATVPTLDFYAPIGDLSRQSLPELFDYHENLVREAVMAAPGTAAARRGVWWLAHNSVPETLTQGFTLRGALLFPAEGAEAPTALTYRAPGVGQLFSRGSWSRDATWLQFTAGPYDQSHAHQDQGNFTLYRNTWQAVTSNIWSNSGLQGNGNNGDLGTGASNVLLFTRPGAAGDPPQTIPQGLFTSSTMDTETLPGEVLKVRADLSDAYSGSSGEVRQWTRELEFHGNQLHVHDVCSVAADVTAAFQLHVPVEPVDHGNGKITAGALEVSTSPATGVHFTQMHSLDPDFGSGWRIELTNPGGCEFNVGLTAG
ncbi:MAG TPA: hypothetical protein VHI77_01210 [Solirubrobacterales bacterium]|nr:hypothetical protein [Solirubrobacterales bacterium]